MSDKLGGKFREQYAKDDPTRMAGFQNLMTAMQKQLIDSQIGGKKDN